MNWLNEWLVAILDFDVAKQFSIVPAATHQNGCWYLAYFSSHPAHRRVFPPLLMLLSFKLLLGFREKGLKIMVFWGQL